MLSDYSAGENVKGKVSREKCPQGVLSGKKVPIVDTLKK